VRHGTILPVRTPGGPEGPGALASVAIVIAAGAGRRLRRSSDDDHAIKPMTCLLGVPLIVRALVTLRDRGVSQAVVVTGYRADELEAALERDGRLAPLTVRFVRNPAWRGQNGLSVLAAQAAVDGRAFLLSMADHVYSGEIVRRLLRSPRSPDELLLAVDRRGREYPDQDDATLVRLDARERITDIGKGLACHDAVDTGVFLADAALFRALEQEREIRGGDCSLSDGVRRLARAGLARGVDVGDTWWHDVDTRADLARAERCLLGRP
jgi:choline kinase